VSAYQKYFAAKDAMEKWRSEIVDDLRAVGVRYLELRADLREAQGQSRYLMDDRFPDSVDDVEVGYDNTVRLKGHWHRRGCSDKEECSLPQSLVYGSTRERDDIFADLETQIMNAKAESENKALAAERATYEALREKFE
jgi:hypothetical protein